MNMFAIRDAYLGLYHRIKQWEISRFVKKKAKEGCSPSFQLTREQKAEIREFYRPYGKVDMVFHRFFTEKTGVFSPYYLPTNLYINAVDEYFNDRTESQVMGNKCYYPMYFARAGIKQAECVLMRMNGFWFTENQCQLTAEQIKDVLNEIPAVFVKKAMLSSGGKGVQYIERPENGELYPLVMKAIADIHVDIVIQRPVEQHPALSAFNPSSVNTIRVVSLLREDGVKIYSCLLKTGLEGSKVDNGSGGGVSCGITAEGRLRKNAHNSAGITYDRHPTTGIVFEDYEIPCFDGVLELVRKAHPMLPHFRLVSWDIAVNADGEAVLIEANLAKGGLIFNQLNNGPLFGDDTKAILDEVFNVTT